MLPPAAAPRRAQHAAATGVLVGVPASRTVPRTQCRASMERRGPGHQVPQPDPHPLRPRPTRAPRVARGEADFMPNLGDRLAPILSQHHSQVQIVPVVVAVHVPGACGPRHRSMTYAHPPGCSTWPWTAARRGATCGRRPAEPSLLPRTLASCQRSAPTPRPGGGAWQPDLAQTGRLVAASARPGCASPSGHAAASTFTADQGRADHGLRPAWPASLSGCRSTSSLHLGLPGVPRS